MPCLECENGLWRFGESGKCQYESFESCEAANADYYDKVDYEFNFTEEMMQELHEKGEVIVQVEKEGKEMTIRYTYSKPETEEPIIDKSNDEVILSMLDEELDEYINKLANSIKKL
jgi:hypothetical protein